MYMPLYEKNLPLNTVEERRAALLGFTYSPFRVNDFMKGIFENASDKIYWEIYDGRAIGADALLYRSGNAVPTASCLYEKKSELELFGRTWMLYFKTLPAFDAAIDRSRQFSIVLASLLISLLLFSITFFFVSRSKILAVEIIRRQKEQEALSLSEQKYRTIMDQAVDALFLNDKTGHIMDVNRKACQSLGYSREELLAMTIADIDPESFQNGKPKLWDKVFAGEQFSFEINQLRKDGSTFPAEMKVGLVRLPVGPVMLAIVRDITERKQAEKELEARNDELTRFNYTVSHDLKSPLVTIKTFLGYLESDMAKADPERVAQDLGFIHTAADKMNNLLNELLAMSRVGRVVNPAVEAPLQDIVQEVLALVAGRITERGVRVQVTQEPVLLYGDRVRLVEVFQNLIDNAVKFMGEQSEPLIEIGAEEKNGLSFFFVRDNGMGIDTRYKDKLFGLFEKLNPDMEGTGLGLALVKRIIELHGGKIWFESEGQGKGACFWFSLPGQ